MENFTAAIWVRAALICWLILFKAAGIISEKVVMAPCNQSERFDLKEVIKTW